MYKNFSNGGEDDETGEGAVQFTTRFSQKDHKGHGVRNPGNDGLQDGIYQSLGAEV